MKFRNYVKEDYFEVTVVHGGSSSANTETHTFPDAKNKKQAEKQAHYQFKKDYGNGKYEIISIKREKGNPGVTSKSPSEYGRERKKRRRESIWENEQVNEGQVLSAIEGIWDEVKEIVKLEIQNRKAKKGLKQIGKMLGDIVKDMEKQQDK